MQLSCGLLVTLAHLNSPPALDVSFLLEALPVNTCSYYHVAHRKLPSGCWGAQGQVSVSCTWFPETTSKQKRWSPASAQLSPGAGSSPAPLCPGLSLALPSPSGLWLACPPGPTPGLWTVTTHVPAPGNQGSQVLGFLPEPRTARSPGARFHHLPGNLSGAHAATAPSRILTPRAGVQA